MLCRKPIAKGATSFGCGQCMPCRMNRRRLWTHRIMLESIVHEHCAFATLTYNNDNLPEGGTVVPSHLQLFMKRLRKRLDKRIRFFGVGEYGDDFERPHYHLALFGVHPVGEGTEPLPITHPQRFTRRATDVDRAWTDGNVHLGTLTFDSAQYLAGYVTKKMTSKNDGRLKGRYPEFARMSLRPGIGAPALVDVADALQCRAGWDFIQSTGDVPNVLRHGVRNMPLGRYMRERLRGLMNFEETGQPVEAGYKISVQNLQRLQAHLKDGEETWYGLPDYNLAKNREAEADTQRVRNMEAKAKIFSGVKKL